MYYLSTYNNFLSVILAAIHDSVFRGFVIQAQEGGDLIGSFTSTDANVQVLDCPSNNGDSTVGSDTD